MGLMASKDDLLPVLKRAGLRPTRQRLALAGWLFDGANKHVTAEELFVACGGDGALSLATVYNSLNKFTAAGLLHQVVVDGGRVYFDTNTGVHHHIFDETTGFLTDIPPMPVNFLGMSDLPAGTILTRVDVVLRVRAVK